MNEMAENRQVAESGREFRLVAPEISTGDEISPGTGPRANTSDLPGTGKNFHSAPLIAALLQSSVIDGDIGCQALRPLWANEAMHRAYSFLQLADLLAKRHHYRVQDQIVQRAEFAIATDLARLYRLLETDLERSLVPCASVLGRVAGDLVALFGPIAGSIELVEDIGSVMLPAFQRRALVLAASELIINALLHGFQGCRRGRIIVELLMVSPRRAQLNVIDNGVPWDFAAGVHQGSVIQALAGLLGSELICRRLNPCGTRAEITFDLDVWTSFGLMPSRVARPVPSQPEL